jgi:hypothetical protein
MKVTKLALAVAATLAASQVYAAPVTQANVVSARSGGTLTEAWLSGASAPTFNIFDGFARGCDADSVSIFSSNTAAGRPGSLGDYNAYACTTGSGTAVKVLYHTVAGGSFNAYAPHIPSGTAPDNTALPAVLQRVKNIGTATCSGSGVYTPTNSPSYLTEGATTIPVSFNCEKGTAAALADNAPSLPHGGFSDVEAKLWGYNASLYGAESATGVQQGFGVAVTTNLYRALQVKQGIYQTLSAAAADTTFAPANAPNITSAQYAAIAMLGGGYQTDWQGILGAEGANKDVNLQRRVATSGTQAASNAFFLNNPCASGSPGGQQSPAVASSSNGKFVIALHSGSSAVKTGLGTINSATALNATGTAREQTAQNFGIGVLSLENTTSSGYKYLKVDGVHPEAGDTDTARATIMDGSYKFVMEMNTFIPTSAVGSAAEAMILDISSRLGNPNTCTDVGRGLALTPGGSSSCAVGAQMSKGTKFGNNCAPMQMFY